MRLYEEMKQLQNEVQRAARLFRPLAEPRQLLILRRVPLDKTCHVDERQL